jgi:hypothetical protein
MKTITIFLRKKSGSELCAKQYFVSMNGISLPAFPFEFSVETVSNKVIDIKENQKMPAKNNVRCKLSARVFAIINRKTPFVNTCKFAS